MKPVVIVLVILSMFVVPTGARACSCAVPTADRLAFDDVAVVAEVVEVRMLPSAPSGVSSTSKVTRVWIERSSSREPGVCEFVDVYSASSGDVCGLALGVGDRNGLLLTRVGATWTGGLCGTTSAERMDEQLDRADSAPMDRLLRWLIPKLAGVFQAVDEPTACGAPGPGAGRVAEPGVSDVAQAG